jgi:hypothetical protein
VGPVAQLAFGGRWRKFTFAGLAEVGYFRGRSSGDQQGLRVLGVAPDSSVTSWFFGPLFEWSLASDSLTFGFAPGVTSWHIPFERGAGEADHGDFQANQSSNAPTIRFWLGGPLRQLGPTLRLAWRSPVSASTTFRTDGFSVSWLYLLDLTFEWPGHLGRTGEH